MNEKTQFAIFISCFLVIYFAMHFYVFSFFYSVFALNKGIVFYSIIILLSLSYVIAGSLERKIPNIFSRLLYIIAVVWFGAIFILFWMTLIFDFVTLFTNFSNFADQVISIGVLVLDFVLVVRGITNAYFIKTKEINLSFKKLKRDLRVVQLSDIHLGTVNTDPFLEKVVSITNSYSPDFVVLTGDLVDGSAPLTLNMLKPLEKINKDIFFVIGNHEIYDGLDFVLPILEKTKLKIIRNNVIDYKGIQIAGIDFFEGNKKAVPEIEKLKINKNKFTILMNHAPTAFETAIKKGVDLELSGHTHNGQIFPFSIFVRFFYKYIKGLYNIGESYLFVSQGTGTWGPPMRLGSESEIIVFNLKKSI